MKHSARGEWQAPLSFRASIDDHEIMMDSDPEFGGQNRGPSPKKLLLAGLAGCTGMDVVSILSKMHVPFDSFTVDVEADQTDEHPKIYQDIVIIYTFTGKKLDREKIEKAVTLSMNKYCGVSAMLEKSAHISWKIVLTQ